MDSLRRSTRDRLDELGMRPSRDLGQNFLVDSRYLDVVEEAAELSPFDVVVEVGGGLGTLSARLAPRVGHLHVIELDRGLAAALEELLAPFANTTVQAGDAVKVELAALEPIPRKLVANLPYGIAATVLLKSIEELPEAGLWVAMVQREVADRLAAPAGSRIYGASSVLAQLACEVRVHRRVPRTAFYPCPRVESAIVVMRRRRPAPAPEVGELVRAAFAHRRKTLAGSLALAPGAPPDVRERARSALVAIGRPPDARAERLAPQELEELADRLGRTPSPSGDEAGG
ncbi:MAG TPA: 16S rRNA (adenine(1518)-N(6)/adenine(1519)-N(6))-dimethyltransferase RsmA [Thermoleophilaceae bacterium]|nr:16S rRNA (adenine(1518)-N(6)/adenine(1519)-N(6))-dimethyltransferase RsmA [Thermoleophilaceae bacterium]